MVDEKGAPPVQIESSCPGKRSVDYGGKHNANLQSTGKPWHSGTFLLKRPPDTGMESHSQIPHSGIRAVVGWVVIHSIFF